MKHLIIHGDPGIRKGAVIELHGEEWLCFSVARQGEYHGPERVQLWCVVGTPEETGDFERRNFVPMHLDVDTADADEVEVVRPKGELTV